MAQPPGFVNSALPNHVCSLHHSLYGLCQAPRAWFQCLRDALLKFGFVGSKTDQSLFIYNKNGLHAYFLLYVDDILLTGSNTRFLSKVVTYLSSKFAVKQLGQLSYFLGVEAHWDPHGVLLT